MKHGPEVKNPPLRGDRLARSLRTSRVNTGERTLLTGASGYVGGKLLDVLLDRGARVRAMVRAAPARTLPDAVQVTEGDAVSGEGLGDALDGVSTAYYLIHSMGAGGGDFAERDRQAARNFGDEARAAGVRRVIYLGGLDPSGAEASEHLRSRHEVAELLGERVPELVYARAAMVIGSGSASFEMLRHLVQRLPVMITPSWVDTRSQPIAADDVVTALADLAERDDAPEEVELGGADVLTYREMMRRFAKVMGRRPVPMLGVPVLTPRLSSYWVALVTPVGLGMARPLVDGLRNEMVVRNPPPPGINEHPMGFEQAARVALNGR